MNWFESQRQVWILETVEVFHFINRVHLQRKFGISTAQASLDLRRFQIEHPGRIAYNGTTKCFEASQ